MRIEQLQQIVTIKQCHSFSLAAEKLFITQPALSRSVGRFETELGVVIFERSAQGVALTEMGEIVVAQAERILSEVAVLEQLKEEHSRYQGHVHVAMSPVFYNTLATELIIRFQMAFPLANLVIKEQGIEAVGQAVASGRFDLGVTGYPFNQRSGWLAQFAKEQLAYERLMVSHFALFVGGSHELSKAKEVAICQISQWPMVEYHSPWHRVFDALGCPLIHKPFVVHDREVMKRLVMDNRAVAILPNFFGQMDLYGQKQLMIEVPIVGGDDYLGCEAYVIYPAEQQLSVLVGACFSLIKLLCEELAP